jgi:ribonuclease P protein component
MENYGKEEENLSTEQSPQSQETRLSLAYEDKIRSQRDQTPQIERTTEINAVSLLNFGLPKENRLRKPREFQEVYKEGKRIEGRFMTVFIVPSETSFQRLGITASKKAIGNAVQRNRAKRLLREAFRLSKVELSDLSKNYDWVLNARRYLLRVKLEKPLEEFRQIVAKVRELELNKGEESVVSEAK